MADIDNDMGFLFTDETAEIYFDSRYALKSLRMELDKVYQQIDSLQSSVAESNMGGLPEEQGYFGDKNGFLYKRLITLPT
jgi:hypothetical protein